MMRNFPRLKSLAICDGPHNPNFENNLIVKAGLAKFNSEITDALRSRTKIRVSGVNHFNWLVEMTHDGQDVTCNVKEALRKATQAEHIASSEKGKVDLTNRISLQLAENVGYVPMCIWHTQEYLPYFQAHDIDKENALTIRQWQVEVRRQWMQNCWDDMQAIASGKRPIDDFLAKTTGDHASDIIEAMWAGLPKRFYINTANNGAVPNMADDAFLELLCVVDMNDVRPLPFGNMPRPLLGYCQRVLDEHELAVEAAVSCDRATLRKAFLASMVAVSIPDVNACMEEMLAKERKYLPKKWYK